MATILNIETSTDTCSAALTDDGARVARGFRGQRREHLSQALRGFTADERAELARLLAKLADAWPDHR